MTFRKMTTAAATLTAALTASAGFAQNAFQDIDTNANGELAVEEIRAVYGDNAQAVLTVYDMDGDGVVTPTEVRQNTDPDMTMDMTPDTAMEETDRMDPQVQSDDASASDLAENLAGEELEEPVGEAAE